MTSFIRTSDHLTIVFDDGHTATVYPSNGQYKNIITALNEKDYDRVRVLSSPARTIEDALTEEATDGNDGGYCEVVDGVVIYNGKPMHNTLTQRMIEMLNDGFDIEPMKKFLVNLYENPSYRSVNELYRFLEKGNLPITDDGYFLAYKKVRADYRDVRSGTFDNSVGSVCAMNRNEVDENSRNECSNGLHFCSRDYLANFNGVHVMIVKINPRDVVAIPEDYNSSKGRTCRYEVIGELGSEEKLEGAYRDTRPVAPIDENNDWSGCGDTWDTSQPTSSNEELDRAIDTLLKHISEEELEDAIKALAYADETDVQEAFSGPIDNTNSAFAGIPDSDVVVPREVSTEIENEVNALEQEPKIEQYDLDGNWLVTHNNLDQAVIWNGYLFNKSAIRRVLKGVRKSVGGYTFEVV